MSTKERYLTIRVGLVSDLNCPPPPSIPGAPAESEVTLKFETQTEQGSVLVVDNPVTLHQVTVDTATRDMPRWIDQNLGILRSKERYRRQITEYGIWVVTKTHTASSCAVAFMSGRSSSVDVRLALNAEGLLVIDQGITRGMQATGTNRDLHKDTKGCEEVVVFMSGIMIKRRPYIGSVSVLDKQEKQGPKLRGDEDEDQLQTISVIVDGEEEIWELNQWGRVEE